MEDNDEVPYWDEPGFEKRVRGKRDRMVKLINLFLKDMPDRMSQLALDINESRMTEARDVAHTIKGVSGNLGVMRLYEAASTLEATVKNQDAEQSQILLPEITAVYQKSEEILKKFVAENPI